MHFEVNCLHLWFPNSVAQDCFATDATHRICPVLGQLVIKVERVKPRVPSVEMLSINDHDISVSTERSISRVRLLPVGISLASICALFFLENLGVAPH